MINDKSLSLSARVSGALRDISSFDHLRFHLAEWAAWLFYPKYKFSDYGRIHLEDRNFQDYYSKFCGMRNVHSFDRKYSMRELLKLCRSLHGDLIEFGVFQGASLSLMCDAAKGLKKKVIGVDSFEGLSKPDERDSNYWRAGDLCADLSMIHSEVRNDAACVFVKGWIPECLSRIPSNQFCFGHIDVDLYVPTKAALEFLYPRMIDRGVILLDDYGFQTCPGAKTAVDDFMSSCHEPILLLPTGQGLIIRDIRSKTERGIA